jgi:integrase
MGKQKQRGHGEGSIYQRKDGRWTASITLENRKRKYFYGETRKEVQEKLKVALHQQQQGTLATGPKQTVKQYLDQWLEEVHKPTIRLSTYLNYRRYLDRYILPALGQIQLQKLTAQQVQALYARKQKEGIVPGTIRFIHAILHKAFDQAVRWKLVAHNVCDEVTPPRNEKHEIKPLTKEQAQKLLETVRGHHLEALLTIALITGMRRGELRSLRWGDINFEDKSLQVCHTVENLTGYGYRENEPKSSRGKRRIALPDFAVEMLKMHRVKQIEARLTVGAAWIDRDLVFCRANGDFLPASTLLYNFDKLLKEAGIPHIRFHDLRHSAATILLMKGVHPKVVQEILGHSSISMTMDVYSHVLPSMQKEVMDKWNDEFGTRA